MHSKICLFNNRALGRLSSLVLPFIMACSNPFERHQNLSKPIATRPQSVTNPEATTPRLTKRMKILFLSVGNDPAIEPEVTVGIQALRSYSISFDHYALTDANGTLRDLPPLTSEESKGLYYGIVLTNSQLATKDTQGRWHSALNKEQWQRLEAYEKQFQVRRVSLNSWPNPKIGMEQFGSAGKEPAFVVLPYQAESFTTGLKSGIAILLTNTWQIPGRITDEKMTKPLLYFKQPCADSRAETEPCGENQGVASAIVSYPDQREQMHFFFVQSRFTKASLVSSHLWLQWITRGFYLGKRRLFLNIQVDDYFLENNRWDPRKLSMPTDMSRNYRLSPSDMQSYIDWQDHTLLPLVQSKDYKIEFAFNGYGVWKKKGYAHDALFKTTQTLKDRFFWVNHTFSHMDLNLLNYPRAIAEFDKNRELAKDLFGSLSFPTYSDHSMITPRISGLFSGEVLRAMLDSQIQYVIGDTTRPEISPENLYVGRWTTKAHNGQDGVLIIPRAATEIYFNVSDLSELMSEYNHFYRKYFQRDLTYNEIYAREADRVVRGLLRLEPIPHMFHQLNMRVFEMPEQDHQTASRRHSLLSLWLESVVTEFRKISDLPILSLKFDDLAQHYVKRMNYEACGFEASMTVGSVDSLSITGHSQRDCEVNVTYPIGFSATTSTPFLRETYGPDQNLNFNINHTKNIHIDFKGENR
ncbi:MAG: hypothetical protein RJB66_1770 [Pseudomonadota bacterium]